jgi:hypothetical protein
MRTHIDTADADHAAKARTLLDRLDNSKMISLGVLSGADLCILGGTEHPVCWEALKDAWQQLDQLERERLAAARTLGMIRRGLVKDQPPGRGVHALICPACYKTSAELAFLLSARRSPASVIATHHESRTPAVTYFQPEGTGAIVEEIPERVGNGIARTARSPLDVIFSYRLLTQSLAAAELARWALKPIRVIPYRPKPPRLICFSGRTEDDSLTSYQLTIYGNGKEAHIDGPDISADLDRHELTRFIADLVTSRP